MFEESREFANPVHFAMDVSVCFGGDHEFETSVMNQHGHQTKMLLKGRGDDGTSAILILVIAHLLFANVIFRLPEGAQLTLEQISHLPLWGP